MKHEWHLVLVLVACGVVFTRVSRADDAWDAERGISRWNPAEEDEYVPPECIRAKSFRLEGEWRSGGESNGSTLRFSRSATGAFAVAFATSWTGIDTVLEWKLKRTARVLRGAVVLNRAVAEVGATYTRLWPLEVGPYRTVALVPTSELDDVRRAYAAGGCQFFAAAFECHDCFAQQVAGLKNP
jgi:hypothetical protein